MGSTSAMSDNDNLVGTDDITPGLPAMSGLLYSMAPAVVFIALNSVFGLRPAIIGATVAIIGQSAMRRKNGQSIGKFWPLINIGVIVRGGIGVIFDSEAVYFGIGIGTKALIGVALIVSVVINRAVVGELLPHVLRFPRKVIDDPIYRKTTAAITVAAGCYYLLSAGWDVWLFRRSSANWYVFIRFFANWGAGIIFFGGAFAFLDKRLKQIDGFDGVLPLLEDMTENMWANGKSDE